MSYEQKDNTGVLFRNEEKLDMPEKERSMSTQADYNGNIKIDGVEYWLNAWIKTGKNSGKKFLSVSVKPKNKKKVDVIQEKVEQQDHECIGDLPF